jgi:hypothetical protein
MDDAFTGTTNDAASESNSSNGNGLHAAKKNPPSVISGQLRDELIRILKTGDTQNEGAFTIAIALQVEKFAVAAREILMTESLAQKDLASLMMMRKHHMGMGGWNSIVGSSSLVGDSYLPGVMPTPIVNNENFGVQAIRQIVDAVRTMGDSPAKLVEALAVARKNGLDDVAADLEKKLGISKAIATPEGTAPVAGVS